jgi:DNA polymerase-3 subunit epsilon
MYITIGTDGVSINDKCDLPRTVRDKGKSLLETPENYTVIDLETTGLDPRMDEIIEIGALKVRGSNIVDKFETLVKPDEKFTYDEINYFYVDGFITELTGITNKMLESAPALGEVLPEFIKFIQDDILLGHNVNFDINFLYDNILKKTGQKLKNNYVDMMRLSRKVYPKFENHKLVTIAQNLGVNIGNNHRALQDCKITNECFLIISKYIFENNINFSSLHKHTHVDLRTLTLNEVKINPEHPLYNKYCTFTGQLEKIVRKDAAQLVVNLGGHCLNSVTKQTNFLILGNFDYVSNIKNGKSSKLKKAEKFILDGQDLQIISEDVFYDLVIND